MDFPPKQKSSLQWRVHSEGFFFFHFSDGSVPPALTFPAAVLAIKEGMLSCSARGTPYMYTALIRNSAVLVNTTSSTATIRLDKDGNYTCQATNDYGTDARELQVNFTCKTIFLGLISLFFPNIAQCLRVTPK